MPYDVSVSRACGKSSRRAVVVPTYPGTQVCVPYPFCKRGLINNGPLIAGSERGEEGKEGRAGIGHVLSLLLVSFLVTFMLVM